LRGAVPGREARADPEEPLRHRPRRFGRPLGFSGEFGGSARLLRGAVPGREARADQEKPLRPGFDAGPALFRAQRKSASSPSRDAVKSRIDLVSWRASGR